MSDQKNLIQVGKEPLFRYNDPARTTTDGTVWLWTQEERPLAIACLFNDSREDIKWNYELVSLTDEALHVDGQPGWNWRPIGRVRKNLLISEPKTVDSEALRLTQMKTILSDIRAEEVWENQKIGAPCMSSSSRGAGSLAW